MSDLNHDLHARAVKALSENEVRKMEHCAVLTGVLYGDGSFHGYDDEYLTPEGRKYRKAVAWMPLPEPYQEEGDSE